MNTYTITDASISVLLLLVTWPFYRAQRDPAVSFNLFDLIMENGRVSRIGFAFMVALVVTSWVLVIVARSGKQNIEIMFAAYGAMWVAPIVAKLFSPPVVPPPPAEPKGPE